MPLIEKRRGLSPGGRFAPGFIHTVIIITGLNKLYDCMFHGLDMTLAVAEALNPNKPNEDGLRCRLGVNPPLKKLKKRMN